MLEATPERAAGEGEERGDADERTRVHRAVPVLCLGAFAVAAAAFRLRATDVFWHLAAGRWILEHRRLPDSDPFRFTSDEIQWVDHEWLFQVLIRLVEIVGGVVGLQVLRQALVLLLAGVLFVGVRRIGASIPSTVAIVLLTLLGARPRFLLRPEILTFIALGLLLIGLRHIARRPSQRTAMMLVGLVVVWVNLHGEAILAPVISGLYLLGERQQPRLDVDPASERKPLSWAWVLGLPVAITAALLINPYGPHILSVGRGITGALSGLSAYNPEWLPLWLAPQPFLLMGFVGAATLGGFAWKKTGWFHRPTLLVTAGLAVVAASAVRHQALFFVAAAFFFAETWGALRRHRALPELDPKRSTAFVSWLCIAAMIWCLTPPSSGPVRPRQGRFTPGLGIEPGRFPEKAADFLERHHEIGPLFSSFAYGGYLLWRLYPPRRVFHDGRMELQPDLLKEIGDARSDNPSWDALLDRYGAVGALVRIDNRPRPIARFDKATETMEVEGYSTSNALLFPPATYALVYWDDLVMLFLDRSESHPDDLLAQEYRYVQPEDVTSTLRRSAADPAYRAGALNEVRRKLEEDPQSLLARALLELLSEMSS